MTPEAFFTLVLVLIMVGALIAELMESDVIMFSTLGLLLGLPVKIIHAAVAVPAIAAIWSIV